jgi:hypothetical protein
MNLIEKNLKRLYKIKYILENNKINSLRNLAKEAKGDTVFYNLLNKHRIIYKDQDKNYIFNSKIPITYKLSETLSYEQSQYYKNKNKIFSNSNIEIIPNVHNNRQINILPKQKNISLFWGLIKINL